MNILSNRIGVEQANKLIKIMDSHRNLKTLCGLRGDETELDLSDKELGSGCGVLVANEVKNNGALTSLNLSENELCDIDVDGYGEYNASGVTALCDAIGKHQ